MEILIAQLFDYLMACLPTIAGTITTVIVPLIIKKFMTKHLDSIFKLYAEKLENYDTDTKKELKEIKRQLAIMRGKAPKED